METLLVTNPVVDTPFALYNLPNEMPSLDVLGGKSPRHGTVPPKGLVTYSAYFQEEQTVQVWAAGLGDIDLHIYDRFGMPVVSDTDEGGLPCVTWTPIGSGEFQIKLVNNTKRPVEYALYTSV